RPKENAAKHPLWSGRGGCFKLPVIDSERVWIIGGLKQPPRLRQLTNGAIFFMAHPPLLREGGECARSPLFPNLDSSAFAKEGWLRIEKIAPFLSRRRRVVVSSYRLSKPFGMIIGSLKQL